MSFPNYPGEREQEVRLVDLATILVRRWRLVAGTVAAVVLVTLALLLLLPARYRARAVIVPAQEKRGSPSAQLLAQLPMGMPIPGMGTMNPEQQLIEAILESSTVAELVVDRVLAEDPELERPAVRRIVDRAKLKGELMDGAIGIEVTTRDPALAERIANAFPESINRIATDLGTQLAQQKQQFLESQLAAAGQQLTAAEEQLMTFQQQRDLPGGEAQAEQTLELAGGLQRSIIAKELEVARLRQTSTPDNPQLTNAQAELANLRQQLRRLASGSGTRDQLLVPIRESPELRVEATRLLRDVRKSEQIYISLTASLADAQIEAHNSLPVVAVLDPGQAERAPRYGSIVLTVAALLGLLLGVTFAFVGEYVRRLRADPESDELRAAWAQAKREALPAGVRRGDKPGGRAAL